MRWKAQRWERRRLHRRAAASPVILSGSSLGKRRSAVMTDISMLGCGVIAPGRYHRGDFVMISAPSFGPFGAIVTWAAQGKVGLSFIRPVHNAVIDHILNQKPPDCPIEGRWRRQIS